MSANLPTPADIAALTAQAVQQLGQQDHAAVSRSAQQIFALDPHNADALYLLGMSALGLGRADLAANLIDKAIARQPRQPYYHLNLGVAYLRLGQLPQAEAALQQALTLKADLAEAHLNLGNLAFERNERHKAAEHYHQASVLKPDLETSWYNLGILHQEAGDQEQALHHFAQALRCNPESASSHMGRASSLLKQGHYAQGWQAYEWRFRLANNAPRLCPVPRWSGEALQGKRLYLYTEQGFGDALMFARFIPLLREMGATVLLECRPELLALFRDARLADQVVARAMGESQPPPFAYDLHLPLLSLPQVLGCTLENLPNRVPYLQVDAAKKEQWADRFPPDTALRVGLSWSGNPEASVNRYRACRLEDLLPLAQVPGITFYSLQKGPPALQLTKEIQAQYGIQALAEELSDFQATAAVLHHLDLLISTDTAIVHLAGALGRPVWTLLHAAAEWRWLERRSDSPWYPGMRLFRQSVLGDWLSPVKQMQEALMQRVGMQESK
ncbi:MAG: tetratricopeptide repeat protein [Magnetococcales bacterium]|nr:tetratricopeptide repeat protein [Magnetococcales bacterium]MBF0117040.1 tetratricopeptide repeat protein [Magnetococcales bacterium]